MNELITLKSGENRSFFSFRDFLELVDETMGYEAAKWLERYVDDTVQEALDDQGDRLYDLESDAKAMEDQLDRYKEMVSRLRCEMPTLARIIQEPVIDRPALSNTAGKIAVIVRGVA